MSADIVDINTGEKIADSRAEHPSNGAPLQVMPELDAEIRRGLRDSIQKFGIMEPIVVTQNGEIIDGHNRWEIAGELGISCPQRVIEVASLEEAIERGASLNLDRRQMDRTARVTLAKSLRESGYSLRGIAGVLGVSHVTVKNDLGHDSEDVPVLTDLTPASGPDKVTGTDGVEQPAKKRGPWSPDELLQLLDRIDAGESRDDIADELDMSRSNLGSLLTRARKLRKGETQIDKLDRLSENVRVEQIQQAAAEGLSSRQMGQRFGISDDQVRRIANRNGIDIPADSIIGRTRRHDSTRIVSEMVSTLEGVADALSLAEVADLDPSQIAEWVTSLTTSIQSLNRFNKQMKEMTRGEQ